MEMVDLPMPFFSEEDARGFLKHITTEGDKIYREILDILLSLDGLDKYHVKYLQKSMKKNLPVINFIALMLL